MKFTLLLLCCLCCSCYSHAENRLLWYHPNFPPANFVDGLMEGLGYSDQAERFFAQRLTDYQHEFVTASYQRILHNLKFSPGCAVGLYKTAEREEFLAYSEPYLLTFPNGLIIKQKDYTKFSPYLDDNGYISLKQLITNEQLIAGITDGRRYQGGIDDVLAAAREQSNIVLRSNNDVLSGLLKMLDKGRVDYLFGLPEELAYHSSLGVLDHQMRFIPIQEMPNFITAYVTCTKSAWGNKVIEQLNPILLQHRAEAQFLRFYEFWLDFESRQRHRTFSMAEFQEQETTKE